MPPLRKSLPPGVFICLAMWYDGSDESRERKGWNEMKRWWGWLAAALLLGLTVSAAAEPAEPAGSAQPAMALLTEPEALPPELTYYRGDTRQETADISWVSGYSGQAASLAAGETLRLEKIALSAAFTLDAWVQWTPPEMETQPQRQPTLLALEGAPGFVLEAAGQEGDFVYSPLLRVTDAADGQQTLFSEGTDGLTHGVWHRLTVTGDSTGTRLYLDGMPVCETPVSVTEAAEPRQLCFGGSTEETGATMLVDEVYLYDRVLTLPELTGSAVGTDADAWDPMAAADQTTAPDPLQPHNRLWILAIPGGAILLLAMGAWWRWRVATRR